MSEYDFDDRIKKLIDIPFQYVCELKFDGASISLTYVNGKLQQALTRGDGYQGARAWNKNIAMDHGI